MSEVVWNKKAFDLLVLHEETKGLIRALIDVRMSKAKKFDDIVSGKGNGLVMLLHGSPGTGKSLTAERFGSHLSILCPVSFRLTYLVWRNLPRSRCTVSPVVMLGQIPRR